MEFKLFELENLFGEIQEIVDYIENSKFDTRKFSLFLTNGDVINYRLYKDHIPHLLGINTTALISTGVFKKQSSYEVLNEMLENPYRIHKLVNDGVIKYENIFSEYMLNKIKGFHSNITPNIYETEFICKYKSNRTYTVSNISANYDYIIVKKIRDTENYACLCLVNNGSYYGAISSTYFETKEELENYLKEYIVNQEITILNGVRTYSNSGEYDKYFNLKPNDILEKLDSISDYKNKFDCIIDNTGGYKYSLSETLKHMDKSYDNNALLVELVNHINEGKVLDRDKFIDSKLIMVVDSFNNYLCNNNGTNFDAFESYTDIQKERKELKEQLEKVKIELETTMLDRDRNLDECTRLKKENTEYKNREESIMKILKPNE